MPTRHHRGAFWDNLHCVDGIRRGADRQVGPSAYLHLERLVGTVGEERDVLAVASSSVQLSACGGACGTECGEESALLTGPLFRMCFSAPTNFARNSLATASNIEL